MNGSPVAVLGISTGELHVCHFIIFSVFRVKQKIDIFLPNHQFPLFTTSRGEMVDNANGELSSAMNDFEAGRPAFYEKSAVRQQRASAVVLWLQIDEE